MEKRDEVRLTVQDAIPEAHLREQRPRQLIWHVSHDILPVSVLFSRMEAAREENSSVFRFVPLHSESSTRNRCIVGIV